MTAKKSLGDKTLVTVAAISGAVLGIGYTGAGVSTGYLAHDSTAENAQRCYENLLPLKRRFREQCEGNVYDNLDKNALKGIISERDQIQKEFGCEKERWICRPINQYRVQESPTEAVYKLE